MTPIDLDDLPALERVDVHDVRRVLEAFPAQCREGRSLAAPSLAVPRPPPLVIVAAMGGSAASGDLLAAWTASRVPVPVLVHRGYGLPAAAIGDTLVVASSYSGNTEEVLSAAREALARRLTLVAVTTGGELGALADGEKVARVTLPGGLMPRMALGHLFFPLVGILGRVGLAAPSAAEIDGALKSLDGLAATLVPACPLAENQAKQLALAIGDSMPAIYGGPATGSVAYRWKTDLAENAKIFALAGSVPEMNHNEIEAWQSRRRPARVAIFLRDPEDGPAIAQRFAVLRDLIRPAARAVLEVTAASESHLGRLLALTCLGQWTSFYVAMRRRIDPWPIPLLNALKTRLGALRPSPPPC